MNADFFGGGEIDFLLKLYIVFPSSLKMYSQIMWITKWELVLWKLLFWFQSKNLNKRKATFSWFRVWDFSLKQQRYYLEFGISRNSGNSTVVEKALGYIPISQPNIPQTDIKMLADPIETIWYYHGISRVTNDIMPGFPPMGCWHVAQSYQPSTVSIVGLRGNGGCVLVGNYLAEFNLGLINCILFVDLQIVFIPA